MSIGRWRYIPRGIDKETFAVAAVMEDFKNFSVEIYFL